MGKIARHIREKVMKLKRLFTGQREKLCTDSETQRDRKEKVKGEPRARGPHGER